MIKGNISSIETSGFVDGPGVRVVVYLQGCGLRCIYCHNPECLNASEQKNIMTAEEVVNKVKKYKSYFGESGGVTFSGGEPLLQPAFLLECLKLCKQQNIHTCLDTAGFGNCNEEILSYVDLVILDVKATNSQVYKKITGQSINKFNQFLNLCQKLNKPLWIRQVIVPDINDTANSVLELKNFISKLNNVQKVELLPYHDMAKDKYKKLGMEYTLENTPPMDKKICKKLQELL